MYYSVLLCITAYYSVLLRITAYIEINVLFIQIRFSHSRCCFLSRYMCGFCQETFTDFEVVQEHVKQHVPDSVQVCTNLGMPSTSPPY